MNLIALAEKLAGEEQAPPQFDAERCLHSRDKFTGCTACVRACPTGAVQPGRPPHFDADACQRCFACLPLCPGGAFAIEDEVPHLLRCLSRLEIDTLELVCQHHPAPERGLSGRAAAIQVRGCLAGLGSAAYLQLAVRPIEHLVVRTDGCDGCPWRSLPELVRHQIAEARQWLQGWQRGDFIEEVGALPAPVRRPLYHAGAPPVSRRGLFRGRAQEEAPVKVTSSLHPYHQRLRTLSALGQLRADASDRRAALPPNSGFAALSVSQACTACGTCARACPSGTLSLAKSEAEGRFELTFSTQACLACDACAHLCPEQAITVHHDLTLEQLLDAPAETTLLSGQLAHCRRCNSYLAAAAMEDGLCPVCAFRLNNPFGSRMPSHLAAALGEKR